MLFLFTVSFEATKPTTEEARNAISKMIGEVIEILKTDFGVKDDIATGYVSISPYYGWLDSGRTLVGQRAMQALLERKSIESFKSQMEMQ